MVSIKESIREVMDEIERDRAANQYGDIFLALEEILIEHDITTMKEIRAHIAIVKKLRKERTK